MRIRTRPVPLLFFCGVLLALGTGGCDPRDSDPTSSEDQAVSRALLAEPPADEIQTAEWTDAIERLQDLGYVGASQKAGSAANVTIHDPDRAGEGYNFYVSGHAAEATLMDMQGRTLHRWQHAFEELERRRGAEESDDADPMLTLERRHWRRAHLYPNGDILAIHSQYALIKLDRNSKLLWEYPMRAHHDLDVVWDGRIYVLTTESRRLRRFNAKHDVMEDFIVVLSPEGEELQKVSLLEAVENAGLQELIEIMPRRDDLLHTNTLAVLDGRLAGRNPAFRRGNVLVSFLTLNTIAIVDLEAAKVVWTLHGDFRFQHDPRLLSNGHILLFDNLGPAMRGLPIKRKRGWLRSLWYVYLFNEDEPENPASAVIEIDPRTGRVVWTYEGSPEKPFSSQTLGAAYRLDEGNTLVVESEFGRVFEVTPEREIVWEFVSPHRVGELVARLFDVVRLPPDFPVDWARGSSESRDTR